MARYSLLREWPESVLYAASTGRLYCAAPPGLVPEHPYTMKTLRLPTATEQRTWGPGVTPRMVLDVSDLPELAALVRDRTLEVSPYNAYLVLRLADGSVVVAYRTGHALPQLAAGEAEQVAMAGSYDVAGWHADLVRQYGGERWLFTAPQSQSLAASLPDILTADW